jgi:hypothetical protein
MHLVRTIAMWEIAQDFVSPQVTVSFQDPGRFVCLIKNWWIPSDDLMMRWRFGCSRFTHNAYSSSFHIGRASCSRGIKDLHANRDEDVCASWPLVANNSVHSSAESAGWCRRLLSGMKHTSTICEASQILSKRRAAGHRPGTSATTTAVINAAHHRCNGLCIFLKQTT